MVLLIWVPLKLQREPVLRNSRQSNGGKFDQQISRKRENIEALVPQSVRERQEPECENCKTGDGPLSSCVSVKLVSDLMPQCANCHFSGLGRRCSFIAAHMSDEGMSDSQQTPTKTRNNRKLAELLGGVESRMSHAMTRISREIAQVDAIKAGLPGGVGRRSREDPADQGGAGVVIHWDTICLFVVLVLDSLPAGTYLYILDTSLGIDFRLSWSGFYA